MTTQTVPLSSLVTIVGGGTPSKGCAKFFEGTIPWVTPKDMKTWNISDSEDHISEEAVESSAAKLVPRGSVLVVVRSGVLKHTLPVAIACRPVTLNQDMKALICHEQLEPRFLAYFLKWSERTLLRTVRGTTADNIPLDELKSLAVPLLPVHEQRRIADILEKADAIRRKRKEAIALTEELLRSAFLEMFGDIPAKRSKWPFLPLRPYLSASSGKSSKGVLAARETDIPVYGGNGINGWATQALYDEPVVVVGRVGQQCGITRMTEGPAWITDNAIVVNIVQRDIVNPVYLMSALQHSPLRAGVMRLDLPFINQSTILDYQLPLPPLTLQDEYAEFRSRVLRAQCSQQAGSEAADSLFASLVHRAFQQELGQA